VNLFGVHPNSVYAATMKNEEEKYLDKVKHKTAEKKYSNKPQIIASINVAANYHYAGFGPGTANTQKNF
jgi:hypothetical protein